jgi:hypothetical protein
MVDWLQPGERWGKRAETEVTENRERCKKIFIRATSSISVAHDILDARVRRKHPRIGGGDV